MFTAYHDFFVSSLPDGGGVHASGEAVFDALGVQVDDALIEVEAYSGPTAVVGDLLLMKSRR